MQYLVAIHRPADYRPASESPQMQREISALNAEMVAAGVRVFVGGLQSPARASAIRHVPGGGTSVTDGPYIETKEHIGGFWVLDVPDLETALDWGRRAAVACRAGVEVRPFN